MPESPAKPEDSLPLLVRTIYGEFRNRAKRLRKWSFLFLVFAVVSLGFGIYLTIFAKDLLFHDFASAGATATVELNKSRIADLRARDEKIDQRVAEIREKIALDLSGGGNSWFLAENDTTTDFIGVRVGADGKRVMVVGWEGHVFVSEDGGKTWNGRRPESSDWFLNSVHFNVAAQNGVAVGDEGVILTTADGGGTWDERESGTKKPLTAVHFAADGMTGGAVGEDGTIVTTTDGGATWEIREIGTEADLTAVHFAAGGNTGVVVGQRGAILVTVDGGENWTRQATNVSANLYAVYITANGRTGAAVGSGGVIVTMSTPNGGIMTWKERNSPTAERFTAVHFAANGKTGAAVGLRGTIVATMNGGTTWEKRESGTVNKLSAVHFAADGKTGAAVGERGTMLATVDGGKTWKKRQSDTLESLRAIDFADSGKTGVAVGDSGAIVITTDFQVDPKEIESVDKLVKFLGRKDAPGAVRNRGLDTLLLDLEGQRNQLSDFIAGLEQYTEFLAKARAALVDPKFLIWINATRVAIIFIILFLVQILVNLYRYNTRLAGYYDARADALMLMTVEEIGSKKVGLDALMIALSPDMLDFGKSPKTAVDHAMGIAKELLRTGDRRR